MAAIILHESTLRECVGIDRSSLDCVAESFGWLHDGRAMVPPVAHIEAADRQGEIDIKTAYVRGVDRFAVKIASGFPGNAARGLPTGSGMMVVFSSETGFCEAVLLDNGFLTDLRTGLAGAVAADLLAPKAIGTVGILGCGVQARYQLLCLALVRKIGRVMVWGRSPNQVSRYVEEMHTRHGYEIETAESAEDLVRQSALLITVTASVVRSCGRIGCGRACTSRPLERISQASRNSSRQYWKGRTGCSAIGSISADTWVNCNIGKATVR